LLLFLKAIIWCVNSTNYNFLQFAWGEPQVSAPPVSKVMMNKNSFGLIAFSRMKTALHFMHIIASVLVSQFFGFILFGCKICVDKMHLIGMLVLCPPGLPGAKVSDATVPIAIGMIAAICPVHQPVIPKFILYKS